MAATLPIDSVWSRKTTRLCRHSSRRPLVVSSCQLVFASPLVVLSMRCPLVVLSRQLVVALLSTCRTSLLSHRLSSSSRCAPCHPLILSSRRLVVASPLDAPPSHRLTVSSCLLSLSHRVSWLSHSHLSSSSSCTVLRPLVLSSCWLVVVLPLLALPSFPLIIVHR